MCADVMVRLTDLRKRFGKNIALDGVSLTIGPGEVERVADRIGVVRRGRLVAVERLEDLAARSLHQVRASFAEDISASDYASLPGVRDVVVNRRTLSCSAPQSSLDALLKKISGRQVVDFECAEAPLEETFLSYYGSEYDGKDGADAH